VIFAYQVNVKPTPEWAYDIQSIGTAIFFLSPFLLVVGLSYKVKIRAILLARIPTAIASFVTLFDMSKEIVGLNNDYSTTQLIAFIIGGFLTYIVQYGIYRKSID